MRLTDYYDRAKLLSLTQPWYREQVERFVLHSFRSDASSDQTSKKLFSRTHRTQGVLVSKTSGVLAGQLEVDWFGRSLGLTLRWKKQDGNNLQRGQVIARISGNTRLLLMAERTILNTLQRLSGIATTTHQCVQQIGKRPIIAATRKTLWGALDKRAVSIGGGYTHRLSLADGILVKDNHLALIDHQALQHTRWGKGLVALEISTAAELKRAIVHYPQFQILLLDNFTPIKLKEMVRWLTSQRLRNKYILEASGGITPQTIRNYSKTGVDVLSLGYLTHSAPALDISLDLIP